MPPTGRTPRPSPGSCRRSPATASARRSRSALPSPTGARATRACWRGPTRRSPRSSGAGATAWPWRPSAELGPHGRRPGPADVVALRAIDAEPAQELERRGVLDILGDRLLAQAPLEAHDRPHGHLVGGTRQQGRDELAVDLDDVDCQVLEVGEGAEAGAEVVQR